MPISARIYIGKKLWRCATCTGNGVQMRLEVALVDFKVEIEDVGVKDEESICITRWKMGEVISSAFRIETFSSSASRLIAAEENRYYILDSRQLFIFDEKGHKLKEIEQFNVNEQRLKREGNVAISQPVIEPSGSILLVGADSSGAYIVRLTIL